MKDFVQIMPRYGCEHSIKNLVDMSRLFHEAEFQMVIQGHRKAGTIHINQEDMDHILTKLNSNGLIFTPLRKSGYYQGFAHTHKEVKPGDPFYWYGCITKNMHDAEEFLEADKKGDHLAVGRLLGFPDCCTKYFVNSFCKDFDPVWIDLKGNVTGYKECNQMLRYFGARITSHLSCSPNCLGTKMIGEKWLEVMNTIDPTATEMLNNILCEPITWDSYHGVVQVSTKDFVGITHTFPINEHRIISWKGE
jgi:hypothetical protein